MEGCFTFQRGGGVVFQIRELHFLSGGCAPWGASVLMGGVFKKKSYDGGVGGKWGASHAPPLQWETMKSGVNVSKSRSNCDMV